MENWIDNRCTEIENSLDMNNSKEAYQTVKDLTGKSQSRTTIIQDKNGNCLHEEDQVQKRWTEYCSELYSHNPTGNPNVLVAPGITS